MNGTMLFSAVGSGRGTMVLIGEMGVMPGIGVLRRGARQIEHGGKMHDAAENARRRQAKGASGS